MDIVGVTAEGAEAELQCEVVNLELVVVEGIVGIGAIRTH
jgi:hypothetical protein